MVIVVDDDANSRMIARIMLEHEGYRVTEFSGGHAARNYLEAAPEPIGVVLLDIWMPDMTGLELLSWIRSQARIAGTPAVIMSALAAPGDIEAGLGAGAAAYLTKPFARQHLLAVVRQACERAPLEGAPDLVDDPRQREGVLGDS